VESKTEEKQDIWFPEVADILNSNTCSMGQSNGKLPLRTCPGCSVPEPYRSPDWALVPAQIGLRAE